jgi:NADPH-dependent 2,4-dienoyl-CoA reductase/sulfur reductase-like enzyme
VVGASTAGVRAAEALRRAGHEGPVTVIGAEGSAPYDRPPLSKQVLDGSWEPGRAQIRSAEQLAKLGLELRLGTRAVHLDVGRRRVALSDGDSMPFDSMILACGAEPRRLPWRLAGIHELRTLAESISLREAFERRPKVAVVGAGFIAAEVASAARARNLEVTMITRAASPFESSLGSGMGDTLAQIYRGHGVDLRCGVRVMGVRGTERTEELVLSDGDVVEADVVVAGIGVKPATDWLKGSGIRLADGVVCDPYCETGVPRVYACGDVARWPNPPSGALTRVEHWTNAVEQARCAAENLVRRESRQYRPIPYFWSDQFGLKVQGAGCMTGATECRVLDEAAEERRLLSIFGRNGRVVGVIGINCPALVGRARRDIASRRAWHEVIDRDGLSKNGYAGDPVSALAQGGVTS